MNIALNQEDSVEKIISTAGPDYLSTLKSYRDRINAQQEADPEIKNKLLQKIDIAIDRVIAPLDLESKLRYIFIPFGIVTLYFDPTKGDLDHFEELGFIKKIKQYYLFSTIGMVMYIAAGVVAALIF